VATVVLPNPGGATMVIRQVISSPSVANNCLISSQTSILPTYLGTLLGRPTDLGPNSLPCLAGWTPTKNANYINNENHKGYLIREQSVVKWFGHQT